MVIDDKYLSLLNMLIYDKRSKTSGMIGGIEIISLISANILCYHVNTICPNAVSRVFVDDFEKGNVVFLLPFGVTYLKNELEKIAEQQEKIIKDFFGDEFREDMIMQISEEERQNEIKYWKNLKTGLDNWEKHLKHENR